MDIEMFPDEIVSEILTRLPAKSVHRFKIVSKRWNSIICNPSFVKSYVARAASSAPPSLYIIDREILFSPGEAIRVELTPDPNLGEFKINPSLLLSRRDAIPVKEEPDYFDTVIQYDHGLVLFSVELFREPKRKRTRTRFSHFFIGDYDMEYTLFVCNVVTRERVRIPLPPHPIDQIFCVGFVTRVEGSDQDNPGNNVSKFVICEYLHLIPTNGTLLLCFSSDTGKWVVKEADYVLELQAWRTSWAFAYNGRLFWVVLSIGMIMWDEDPFCAAENECKAVCRLISLPPRCIRAICTPKMAMRRRIGVSGGFIQFIEMIMSGKTMLRLWRLKDTESDEWVLLYKVSQKHLVGYLHHHLSLTLPTVCFVHPSDVETVFLQTGAYLFSYNLRSRKVVSVGKFKGHGEFLPVLLPTWPTSIPPRLYAAYAKEEGNEFFNGGKIHEAISCYSNSISMSPSAPTYANRALAYLRVSRFREAEDDCTHALSLDGAYVKVLGR